MKYPAWLVAISTLAASCFNALTSKVYAFPDIETYWASSCITQLQPRNLVTGYPDGTFRPNGSITRAEFAVLMLNAFPNGPIIRSSMKFQKANKLADGTYTAPSLTDWQQLLERGQLASPREAIPTPLEPPQEPTVFGRVAGVSVGSQWTATITDEPSGNYFRLPPSGSAVSYVLGTLHLITLGTQQIQSAKMLRRYPDTAYFAHSNYGVEYSLTLPLKNTSTRSQTVSILLQTPLKDEGGTDRLLFVNPQDERIFFRGTVRLRYPDEQKFMQTRYVHLIQRRVQPGKPLVTLTLPPNAVKQVMVDFIYPPDATPPQVLTVKTL